MSSPQKAHLNRVNSDKEFNLEDADDDKYRKIGSVTRLFEESNRDYYKPKVIEVLQEKLIIT